MTLSKQVLIAFLIAGLWLTVAVAPALAQPEVILRDVPAGGSTVEGAGFRLHTVIGDGIVAPMVEARDYRLESGFLARIPQRPVLHLPALARD